MSTLLEWEGADMLGNGEGNPCLVLEFRPL
jgi:hypothetical protein